MRIQSLFNKKAILLSLATVAVVAGSVFGLSAKKVNATDCSPNAIMHCGTSSAPNFISNVKSSNGGTQTDLAQIYADYGLTSADYNRFVSYAQPGTAYKNGTIVVNGKVVANNAESIGRSSQSYSHARVINGKTYYESRAQDVFLSNSIGVMAFFDASNNFQFAVMYDCGNPTAGTPTYACNNLNTKQVNRTSYQFSTSAAATNGANVNHVVYDFGDGTTRTETNPSTVVSHTYAKAGSFTAKVTVYVNLPGGKSTVIAAAGQCAKKVVVAPAPVASCTSLVATILDLTTVKLSAKAVTANGAGVLGYDFVIKNAAGAVVQTKSINGDGLSTSPAFTITAPGNYAAYVNVRTSIGTVSSAACRVNFTMKLAPVASCTSLVAMVLDSTTVKLSAKAAASNGAGILGYDFSVKNAAGKVVATKTENGNGLATSPTISITTPGAYSASVSVRTTIGTVTSAACNDKFTIAAAPAVACTSLSAVAIDRNNYKLNVAASVSGGATIQGYDFVVKDASGKIVTNPSVNTTATTASQNVNLANDGTYTVQVSVRSSVGVQTGAQCQTSICIKPVPVATCKELTANEIDRTNFTLNATATAGGGATIQGYDFVVKDASGKIVASPSVTTTATTASVPVALTTTGTYSAAVSVRTSIGTLTGAQCQTTITVKALPVAACTSLSAVAIDRTNFTLHAAATVSGGATISGYDFVVKDASGKIVTNPSVNTTATTASQNVALEIAGTYSASVSVRTSTGVQTGAQCATTITVNAAPVAACVSLSASAIDRLDYKLNATASAANGATIQGYDFVVKDASGKVVSSPSVTSTATMATTNVAVTDAGTYSASVSVRTSTGVQTGAQCATSFTVAALPPSIKIEKHVDNVKSEQVAVGQVFTYELVVTNNGKIDLHNAVVSDPAPAGVTMISADRGTIANNAWTFTIPSLAIGASENFNITAKVAAYVEGSQVNTACVNTPEVNPGNPTAPDDCDSATTTVVPPAPLNPNIVITKTVDGQKSEQVAVGQVFTYQLVVTNKGEVVLNNAVVTDPAPQGVTLLSADQGTIANNAWTFTIPSLAVGESATFNLTGKVADYVPGSLVNTACVNAPEVNPENPTVSDSCDTATVTVTPPVVPPVTPPVTPPAVLPNTGAGNVVGIFAATVLLSGIGYRLVLSRKLSRQN